MITNFSDTQEVSKDTLLEKYCKDTETTQEEIFARVAKGVASVEKTKASRDKWEKKFYQNMLNGAIGAGRIMGAAGTSIQATLNNCYVQGVGDSIQDQEEKGYPGIYIALKEAAETMRRGGGVGYDFSRIRPKNAEVKGTASFASGPCSYIDVFDISCQTVESAGCFASDTLINTDKGLVPIKEIVENTEIEYFANTHEGPRRITTRFNNGEKKLLKITTEYGFSVKVTEDHKFAQLDNGRISVKPIKDIIKSDNHKLLISVPVNFGLKGEWTTDTRLAYLIGAFMGNGSWTKNEIGISGIVIANNVTKVDVMFHLHDIASELGFNPILKCRPRENCAELRIYNTQFFNELKRLGVEKGDNLKVPDIILKGNQEEQAAFIAGLFDADGSVSETKSNIRLRMISKELLEQVQIMLVSLGVMNKVVLEREEIGNWRKIYCLGIFGSYAQKAFARTVSKYSIQTLTNISSRDRVGYGHYWNDVAPFGHIKGDFKQHWPGDVVKHPKISMNAITSASEVSELVNTVTAEIVDIEQLGVETVYDLEVDEVHLLSGNGIYTSNSRRGAQLASLRVDHPDIELYITAKRTPGRWNNFNVSVFVTDEFMEAVKQDKEWGLVHKAKPSQYLIDNDGCYQREDGKWVYKKVKARDLWDTIMKSNYDFAEPGILFGDNINNDNNLRYTEVIEATNP